MDPYFLREVKKKLLLSKTTFTANARAIPLLYPAYIRKHTCEISQLHLTQMGPMDILFNLNSRVVTERNYIRLN